MFRAQWEGLGVLFAGTTFQAEWTVEVTDILPTPRRFRLLLNLELRTIGLDLEWVLAEDNHPPSLANFRTFTRSNRGLPSISTYQVVWRFDVRHPEEAYELVVAFALEPREPTTFDLYLRRATR